MPELFTKIDYSKSVLSPEIFLNSLGIDLKKTALLTCMGEHMKQPDLCYLLEEYAARKFKELASKAQKEEINTEEEEWMNAALGTPKKLVFNDDRADIALEPGTGH